MTDWMTRSLAVQRDLIRAQQAQMDAAQTMLDAGRQMAAMQQAGLKAAEANLAMWRQWSAMWGLK